jgi:hypothetical protein
VPTLFADHRFVHTVLKVPLLFEGILKTLARPGQIQIAVRGGDGGCRGTSIQREDRNSHTHQ